MNLQRPAHRRALAILVLTCPALAWPAHAAVPRIVVSPATPTTSDRLTLTIVGDDSEHCSPFFTYALVDGRIVADGTSAQSLVPCAENPWSFPLDIPPLAAGTYGIEVRIDDLPYTQGSVTVGAAQTFLVLAPHPIVYLGTYFAVEVDYAVPEGETEHASGSYLSPFAALFWFRSPQNPEVQVKILDGRAINGHYWLFLSTLTSLEHTVRIHRCADSDPPFCSVAREYHSPAGQGLDVIDTEAF